MDAHALMFYLFGAATLSAAVGVAGSRDIMRSAVWLLAALAGLAGLYWNLGADFVAVSQLMIYVGGVTVLLLLGVMVTHRGPLAIAAPPNWERAIAASLAGGLFVLLAGAMLSVDWSAVAAQSPSAPEPPPATETITPEPTATVRPLGHRLLTDTEFLLPFYLTGLHLLVVMIGAAHLAARRRERESPEANS